MTPEKQAEHDEIIAYFGLTPEKLSASDELADRLLNTVLEWHRKQTRVVLYR
jgi:hypothetical protein